MANEQINIEKLIYGKNSIKDNLDTTFSELTSKAIPIDLQQFFDEYDKLFYDIPEVGINSHTSLMERSRDSPKN
mgnify:FL=1